jgi:hypothetical protein
MKYLLLLVLVACEARVDVSPVGRELSVVNLLVWEQISPSRMTADLDHTQRHRSTSRAQVPGGWLIHYFESVTFVPDPEHKWLAK